MFRIALALFGAVFAASLPVAAQQNPSFDADRRPITILVGFAPGGSEDVRARALATQLSEVLGGRSVLVVNRSGAAGTLMLSQLAKSKPDGLTIGSMTASSLIYAAKTLKPDFSTSDFSYLAGAASQPYCICVSQDAPWKTLDELVAYAKANPGKVSYAHPGIGHFSNVIIEVIAKKAGVKLNAVPFRGDSDSINAILGGHVDVASLASTFVPFAKSGKVRVLALLNEQRLAQFPNAPTIGELGFPISMKSASLLGYGAPKGLPADVQAGLEKALEKAIKSPEFKASLERLDNSVDYRTSAQFVLEVGETKVSAEQMIKEIE